MEDGGEGVEHDRRRMRQTRRVLGAGCALAVVAALGSGIAGLPGRLGALVLLLVAALAFGVAGLHGLVLALVDDLRDRTVAPRRPLVSVGLLVVSGALMAMAGAAATG